MNGTTQGVKPMTDLRFYLLMVAASWLPFGAAGQNANANKPIPAASAGPYQALMTSDASLPTHTVQWELRSDQESARMFLGDPCGLAKAEGWKVEKKNIP